MSVEENFTEGKVDSVATPSAVGNDKETQQTITHPPETAPEALQVIDDDSNLVLETTTDGGQNSMTPDTATAMSMRIETLSTPTVNGGGCPSDEPFESQRARLGTRVLMRTIDAGLLLHVRYQSGQDATTETSAPILSLRVTSTVLWMASPPLEITPRYTTRQQVSHSR
ncbi:hypothetical protein L211DRAFT_885936 [Terfezia boudieri ATCC MYA-4762]|uniref:Uncharacterized protein n=1 Tax=Terfezia boudieri ATCC MYA-4762 TaxID=1051890 RepID=A0A3N4LNA7_9PEZI|nr:hypothetical protein L211DRAFT_885936 [Terfezia boudieri ATCC MYA-4762]